MASSAASLFVRGSCAQLPAPCQPLRAGAAYSKFRPTYPETLYRAVMQYHGRGALKATDVCIDVVRSSARLSAIGDCLTVTSRPAGPGRPL
jgi:hypothetical protein